MKQFKKTKKKQMKYKGIRKPRFKTEFYKIIAVCMIIVIPVELLLTSLAAESYANRAYKQLDRKNERITDHIENRKEQYEKLDYTKIEVKDGKVVSSADTPEERDWMNQEMAILRYRIETSFDEYYSVFDYIFDAYNNIMQYGELYYGSLGSYCELYNTDGVKIMGNDNAVVQIVSFRQNDNEERKPTRFYCLDSNQVEKLYPDFWDIISEKTQYKTNNHHDVRLVYDEIYVKDGYFLPKFMYLKDAGNYDTGVAFEEEEWETIETFDLTSCDFSGYELYEVDEDKMHKFTPLCYMPWYGADMNRYYQYRQRANEEEIIKKITSLKENNDRYDYFENLNIDNGFKVKFVEMKKVVNSDLVCVVSADYDFFRDWKGILILFYSVSLLLVVLVSLVIAGIIYTRKKHLYERYVYRRDMTNAMAHDLKSPLMAISGYAENLNMALQGEKEKHYVGQIMETVCDMNQMIANILDLSKLEESEYKMKWEDIALEPIVQEQLAKYKERMDERGLEVTVEGDAQIKADAEWMGHLVDNLFSNVVKYAKENSTVQVRMSDNAFVIENDFDGEMNLEPKLLLEPFTKGDNARNNTEGNGVGLSIVKRIAQEHKYKVEVSTEQKRFIVKVNMK